MSALDEIMDMLGPIDDCPLWAEMVRATCEDEPSRGLDEDDDLFGVDSFLPMDDPVDPPTTSLEGLIDRPSAAPVPQCPPPTVAVARHPPAPEIIPMPLLRGDLERCSAVPTFDRARVDRQATAAGYRIIDVARGGDHKEAVIMMMCPNLHTIHVPWTPALFGDAYDGFTGDADAPVKKLCGLCRTQKAVQAKLWPAKRPKKVAPYTQLGITRIKDIPKDPKKRVVWACPSGHRFKATIQCLRLRATGQLEVCMICALKQYEDAYGIEPVSPVGEDFGWRTITMWACKGCGDTFVATLQSQKMCCRGCLPPSAAY